MEMNYAARAEEYYKLVGEKDEKFTKFLHPNVEFYGPLAALKGKAAVIDATTNFMKAFTSLEIRAKFGAVDQAMVVYHTEIPGIAKDFPSASLLTFIDGLIVRIELFYDASRFAEKKKEIFSK